MFSDSRAPGQASRQAPGQAAGHAVRVAVPARVVAGDVLVAVLLASAGVLSVGLGARGIPLLYLAAVTAVLVRTDIAERRLPNRLVLPGYLVCAVAIALEWLVSGTLPVVALVSGAGFFALLLAAALAGGMGMGDVKLGGVLGLSAGLVGIPVALAAPFAAFALGGLWSVVLLVRGRGGARIPFGPFLFVGYWLAVILPLASTPVP